MYVLARNNSIIALDAATGRAVGSRDRARHPAITNRGINYWRARIARSLGVLQVTISCGPSTQTGKTIETFGDGGRVNLGKVWAAINRSRWSVPRRAACSRT
jgi:quinoprotein glucose dehydrogenase